MKNYSFSAKGLSIRSYGFIRSLHGTTFLGSDQEPAIKVRTFKAIDFSPLVENKIFELYRSVNKEDILRADGLSLEFMTQCFCKEFSVTITFATIEEAGKFIGKSIEGRAWQRFYRQEHSFFMSTYEVFEGLGMTKEEIERVKADQIKFSEFRKDITTQQNQLADRHAKERRQLVEKIIQYIVSNNLFLALSAVSEEALGIQEQLVLAKIVDEDVRKLQTRKMIVELKKKIVLEARSGKIHNIEKLFGA